MTFLLYFPLLPHVYWRGHICDKIPPMLDVTFFPILIASVANMIIGFVWYSPYVFGSVWMRLSGVTPEMVESGRRRMPMVLFVAFLAGVVMAYVMNYFGRAWFVTDTIGALELAFWLWIGFVAPVMLGTVLWEQKSFMLYLINAAYWLFAMVVMALVLVL